MNIEFLDEAREEFHAAALFYESREKGLGKRFEEEIRHVCAAILHDPLLWRERSGGYRCVNCPVFPYYVAYIMEKDIIYIIAIAHGHRHPNYWKDRH